MSLNFFVVKIINRKTYDFSSVSLIIYMMKRQVYNPYLPLYEYTPDCEPHIFNDRVYVYGSHDQFGAFQFCHNSYVAYSTSINDLSDWKYEGVILDKREDPDNKKGKMDLYAPDVTCGPDKRYYIYYAFSWTGKIGVAVSSSPSGPFKFLGHVHYKDGKELGRKKGDAFHFDPAIFVDDDNRVYLYSGFGAISWFPQIRHGLKPQGGYVIELEQDMVTIKSAPLKIMSKANDKINLNGASKEHAFFEASSLRKIKDTYYFIYSSLNGHELCYMTSPSPIGPFQYQGVIISNGDVGLNGRTRKEACYPLGNNHGSIIKIKKQWYVFYHRHTNYTNTDRQDCAEKIEIDKYGKIKQVEMTSCGLNDGPLNGHGIYPASICCCLKPFEGNVFYPFFRLPHQKNKTYITQSKKDNEEEESQYIHAIKNGCLIGYKYFDLSKSSEIKLHLIGKFKGTISLKFSENGKAEFNTEINHLKDEVVSIKFNCDSDESGLYLYFKGKGRLDFTQFELI